MYAARAMIVAAPTNCIKGLYVVGGAATALVGVAFLAATGFAADLGVFVGVFFGAGERALAGERDGRGGIID